MDITHSYFGHDFTPCHVELLKPVIQHNSNDHNYLIQYDYKSSCKHSCFFVKILLVYSCFFMCLVPIWLVVWREVSTVDGNWHLEYAKEQFNLEKMPYISNSIYGLQFAWMSQKW